MYEDFFANRVYSLRLQKGVSARDMSLSIGQSESYINKIESGKSFPSMQAFFYICEYLEVSPKDFFNEGNSNPVMLNNIISKLENMNSKDLELILTIIEGIKK